MVIKRNIWYPPAAEERTLHIWLPDSYDSTEERYPVMYFFDGHNLFFDHDATYGKSWGMKKFLESWPKNIIIVGMECSHTGNDRLREYCPYKKRMFNEEIDGIGDQTFDWVVHGVKAMVDSEYRTWSHREATGIAGSSMGGLMAMHGAIHWNKYFSKAAAVSAGIFHNLSDYRRELYKAELWPDTRIFISWGEFEAGKAPYNGNPATDTREARSAHKFSLELREKGIESYTYFQPKGRHCEEDWGKQLPYLMFYLWLD